MMRLFATLMIFVTIGGCFGGLTSRLSPSGFETQASILFQGGGVSTEQAFISAHAFQNTLDPAPRALDAAFNGQVMTVTTVFATAENNALGVAADYLAYRETLANGSANGAEPSLSLSQAQQEVMQAQLALREAQLAARKPLTPVQPMDTVNPIWQSEIERQNHAFAQQSFATTGRLDGVAHDHLSPLYHSLTSQLVSLNSELAGKRVTYGNRHPDILRLTRQIHTLEAELKKESQTILNRMEGAMPEPAERPEIQGETPDQPVNLTALTTRLMQAKQRLQQAQAGAAQGKPVFPTASLVGRDAGVTPRPVYDTRHDAITGAALGFVAGLLFSLLRLIVAMQIRNPKALENETGLPVYSMVPTAHTRGKEGLLDHLLVHSNHALAESLRHIRTQMRLRHKGLESPRVVAVTSPLPGDGKTTLTAMLATICAQCGDRVLVIDGDLRRPSVDKTFAVSKKDGLVDVLTGRVPLDNAIQKKHETGVHILTARATPSHALALVDSAKFWQILRELRGDYDLVLLDTPSLLNFSDALILSGQADLTLLATRQGASAHRLRQAVELLKPVSTTPLAAVMTRVQRASHRKLGGYADYTKKR